MTKIGVIGEDPNDTMAIIALLNQKYSKRIKLTPLLQRITGCSLDSDKIKRALKTELETPYNSSLKSIIFIRDLDSLETNKEQVKKRKKWFTDLNKLTENKGIFLLNIFEIEALILADIDCFNKIYKSTISYKGNPMYLENPKEFLKSNTKKLAKKYHESHCPDIFKELDISTISKRCNYFKNFISDFDKKIK